MSGTEQVVVVLGTGEGKSILFMLLYILPDTGITILILPLVSLCGDLLRQVRELAIDHWVWTLHETRTAPLVFVSAKAARTKAFRAYAYKLAATGSLGQIVLDEAHFTVTASEYRAAIVDLALIRGVRTQFVYLTATLPLTLQAQFEVQNNLINPKIIRASTNQQNLFYIVERVTGPRRLLEEGARRAKDA
jgi:superfamily II DNA helicase RecQ